MPNLRQRMSDIGRALRGNPLDNPAIPLSSPAAWIFDLFGGHPTAAGVSVNERTAMQLTSVYACINVLASAFSSLPCELLERKGKSKQAAVDQNLYYLLAVEPNPEMSAVSFWGCMIACAALLGNGFAIIQWENESRTIPAALWPIHPSYVSPRRNPTTKALEYHVTVDGVTKVYSLKDMIHVPALTLDGFVGVDPIKAAKQSIGTGLAAGQHIGAFFGRGSRPSGILTRSQQPTTPGTLGTTRAPETNDSVRESWERANAGDNQGRTAVLPAGWDWKAISITPEQAQFLQIMQYTRTEIAGLWQIPPHMIGDTTRLSNANGQTESLSFLTFTLRPWIVRFESEIARKLLPKIGRSAGRYTIRFDTNEMLRLDFSSQIEAIAMGRQWGIYNANEGREKLGDNPIPGKAGTQYLVPLNMVDADTLGDKHDATAAPVDPLDIDLNADPEPDDTPAGNGGQNQRSKLLLNRMCRVFAPLFRDAAGRLLVREKRDAAAVQQVLGPTLSVICDEVQRQARSTFRLEPDVDLGAEKVLRELARHLERRAAKWTTDTIDADADSDLAYCVRSISKNIFREAGAAIV